MFSGKSSALIAEYELAAEESKKIMVVKPTLDNRYDGDIPDIVSHDGTSLYKTTGCTVHRLETDQIIKVEDLEEEDIDLLLIDEAQFFTKLSDYIDIYLQHGIDVTVAGLDMDSEGRPFGCMPLLLAKAEVVYKLPGICSGCGEEATRTFRKLAVKNSDQVLIGGMETYEPRCYEHWLEGQAEKRRWLS
jgi:thymidine kinase